MSEPLWRWRELCAALDLPGTDGPEVKGICIDSRKGRPGDLFVALSGDPGARFNPSSRSERDGHDFVDAAVAAGAVGVLAHDGKARTVPQLQVQDTLDGLWALGRAGRARLRCPVVAVTGSSGKTTLKSFLSAALDAFATSGSLNNHLGVPLSLSLTPRHAQVAVYELGMNHPGEIAPLAMLTRPDVAVVLNVGLAHLENFSSPDGIRKEKLSIYKGLQDKGHLIVEDSVDVGDLPRTVALSRFGRHEDSRVQLVDAADGRARYRIRGTEILASVPGGGSHRAMTLAAVLCVLDVLGRDPSAALNLPQSLVPAGRGQEHRVQDITLIDDSYNANPASMAAALESLAARDADGRRIAVLGEMLELGPEAAGLHRGLAASCSGIDQVLCVADGMRPLYESLPGSQRGGWFEAADAVLLDSLAETLGPGDTVLVKGSNRVFWRVGFVEQLIERLRERRPHAD
ncbi:MAG: UDP-N-acetylmuramoyl-tripeptide--D-alanyl-D-alanine ligase [Pseudomonadales bacterium]